VKLSSTPYRPNRALLHSVGRSDTLLRFGKWQLLYCFTPAPKYLVGYLGAADSTTAFSSAREPGYSEQTYGQTGRV